MKVLKVFVLLMMLASASVVNAQAKHGGNRLSKEQFMAELEKFIAAEADLTPQECNKLFPVMREMYSKQRVYFDKMKNQNKKCPQTEAECREAVRKSDQIDPDIRHQPRTSPNAWKNVVRHDTGHGLYGQQ